MIGIPFTVRREDEGGVVDRTIYLRSRRRGPEVEKMRAAIRAYNRAIFGQGKQASRAGMLMTRALAGEMAEGEDLDKRLADLERIDREQEAAMTEAQELAQKALDRAEEIAELALRENYGEQTAQILNELTDRELHAIVGTVEMGAMPKDFFPSPATPPKPSSISPPGSAPAEPSSPPATPGAQ